MVGCYTQRLLLTCHCWQHHWICVGHNNSGNISWDFCKLAGIVLPVDPGVKLREFPWRKVHPRTELVLHGKKYEILCLNCCLLVRRRNWGISKLALWEEQSHFMSALILVSTACIRVILWCVALGWHHCITSMKSYCAFLGLLLCLSCVKGFLCFVYFFPSGCALFISVLG